MSKLTTAGALQALRNSKSDFARLLEREDFDVGLYKPDRIDAQTPHARDELYVIASGSGFFHNGENVEAFQAADVFFVPAGVEHRFADFSDDFAAWVIFIGPRPH